jgi:hypothetical protein
MSRILLLLLLLGLIVPPVEASPRPSAIVTAAEIATCMTPPDGEWIVAVGSTRSAALQDGFEIFARVDLEAGPPTLYLISATVNRYDQQRGIHARECAAAIGVTVTRN